MGAQQLISTEASLITDLELTDIVDIGVSDH
jgi:hypothetical protein